jgi:hypothetical protein
MSPQQARGRTNSPEPAPGGHPRPPRPPRPPQTAQALQVAPVRDRHGPETVGLRLPTQIEARQAAADPVISAARQAAARWRRIRAAVRDQR